MCSALPLYNVYKRKKKYIIFVMDSPILTAPHPFTYVLFGASGNLAKLKLYPALFVLFQKKRLSEQFSIIGFARTGMDENEFRAFVKDSVRSSVASADETDLEAFASHVFYHAGDYGKLEDFQALHDRITEMEKDWEDPVRLAYLSIPPQVFVNVLHNLCESDIHAGKFRCIVEKPVGHDSKSFDDIRKALTSCFREEEIYLLDHYLGKEAVRNVYYLRYANPILERILAHSLIHHVEITASESKGLEGRAGYFDVAGTLRDYFQNHMLLMAALLTMDLSEADRMFGEHRLQAMQQFYLPPAADLNDIILQGQYGAGMINGEMEIPYREEEGIQSTSRTNTFIAMKLMSKNKDWEGVPFYLRAGKRLQKRETRISIQFNDSHPAGKNAAPNRLDIILQGEAGMKIYLQTKVGGTEPKFRPLVLTDPLEVIGDVLPEHGLLILEALHGKKQWFMTFDEVGTAWRLMDPLQAHLDKPDTPLAVYPAGIANPHEAEEWIARHGAQWSS